MKHKLIIFGFICIWANAFNGMVCAQENQMNPTNHILRTTSYGVGFASVFDTYLSPQEYKGVDFRITRETMKMTRLLNGNVSSQVFFQANVAYTHNKADNNNTFSGLVNWNYGLHYQFRINENFKILTGGLGDFNGGFVYNLRNSNNPASARAYINLAASAMFIWHFKIKNAPLILRYQANFPVAGVMFSPHYGQSYYEIFTLGNSSGVIKFVSLNKQLSLRQLLTLDFPLGNSRLRFSYLWDTQQSDVNQIRTHTYGHIFLVGVVKNLYRIRNKDKSAIPSSLNVY